MSFLSTLTVAIKLQILNAKTRAFGGGDTPAFIVATMKAGGNRIEREIAEYDALSQQVMQLTKIIFESVKKLPVASSISR